ncbi:MAG TPA: O-methyltransferase [Candidatus Eisenbacteria bacterium]|nr:O-methyltransferase [Candidatus Eisenbacteria bacterium]
MREIDHKITDPKVDNYLYAMLPKRTAVLAEIERQADECDIPIVGPAVGRLLYQYARLIGANTVFEMGSAVGYSTIWWAMAVGEGGKVHYTDGSRKNADEARGYFERAGVCDRIQIHVGDAIEVLSERKEQFDVLFCDIDKHDYPRAARMAPERVRPGGLFITDNTLWRGEVAFAAGNPDFQPGKEPDAKARAIVEFNELLYKSPDWYTTIIPLRDGVTVAMRI